MADRQPFVINVADTVRRDFPARELTALEGGLALFRPLDRYFPEL